MSKFPFFVFKGNTSSWFTSASSPCGSYHRRLRRSHATSIDNSFGRKSDELSEDVSSQINLNNFPHMGVNGFSRPYQIIPKNNFTWIQLRNFKKNNTCILTSEMNKMDGNLQSQHRMHWLYFTCCKFGISAYSRDLLIAE